MSKERYYSLPADDAEFGDRHVSRPRRAGSWRSTSFVSIMCLLAVLASGFFLLHQVSSYTEPSQQESRAPEPSQALDLQSEEASYEPERETIFPTPEEEELDVEVYQSEPPLNATKHLVIASTSYQDVGWLQEVPSDWQVKRYLSDDPNPDPSVGLPVPRNYGREVMAYLTYIIDHYDDLPDYVAFVHGHYRSWHQQAPISMKIRALNLTSLWHEDYISFRCEDNMGCERRPYIDISTPETVNWWGEISLQAFWGHILPGVERPQYVSYKCCAQHAVTAAAIRTRTKEQWIRIRSPLLAEEADLAQQYEWARQPGYSEWLIGTWYEKYWHVLLGAGNEFCPSLEVCRQRHFSNAIVCDSDADMTPFEKDIWRDNRCVTAFDGVQPDDEPDWSNWDPVQVSADIRTQKAARLEGERAHLAQLEAEHEDFDRMRGVADAFGEQMTKLVAADNYIKELEEDRAELRALKNANTYVKSLEADREELKSLRESVGQAQENYEKWVKEVEQEQEEETRGHSHSEKHANHGDKGDSKAGDDKKDEEDDEEKGEKESKTEKPPPPPPRWTAWRMEDHNSWNGFAGSDD